MLAEIHQEVADLLGGPRAVGVRGDSEDVHVPVADLDDEQAIEALQLDGAIDAEEVRGEHGRGLGQEELPPAHVGVPVRCRGYPQGPQDPADSGRADPVAKLEQLALDPLISPWLAPAAASEDSAWVFATGYREGSRVLRDWPGGSARSGPR